MSEIDFSGKTPDELEALMEQQELPTEATPPESVTTEPEPTEPPNGEPADDAPNGTDESVEQTAQELLLARLELAEEERRKAEQVAGRHGGELGYLRNKVRELEESIRGRASEPDLMGEPEVEPPVSRPQSRDKVAAYVVARAVPDAITEFERRHPDSTDMAQPILSYLNANGFDLKSLYEMDDPTAATQETERALSEAYYHVRAEAKAKIVADLTSKRADQFARMEDAKKRATMSGGGGSSPPPTRQKTIDEMTPDELDAEMRKLNPVY